MPALTCPSPLGPLTLVEQDGALVRVDWGTHEADQTPLLIAAMGQIAEYFAGQRKAFDLPLAFGAGFQGAMNRAMHAIPFGETRTYGDLAKRLGRPAQAIGQACGANPLPILIPCHRVLGATTLGGFSAPGGIESKVWLLKHEGAGLLI